MVIMLTDKVFDCYQQKAEDVKASFSLDNFTEWNKIPQRLRRSQQRKGMDPVELFT
jgi:hypothetical protein